MLNWGSGNINQDPIFCDQTNGDYTIDAISPCVGSGENSANIGAYGIGCESIPYAGPIWHVSTGGSDDNDGSESYPFVTIQKGIDAASDGDTVFFEEKNQEVPLFEDIVQTPTTEEEEENQISLTEDSLNSIAKDRDIKKTFKCFGYQY